MTLDEKKAIAAAEAAAEGSAELATFVGDAIAYANLYTQDGSAAHNDNNPGLLTAAWDPMNATLPKDGGAIIYPNIDAGIQALHTFVGKVLAGTFLAILPTITIADLAKLFAPARSDDWSTKFCSWAGVTQDQKLQEVTG